MWREVLLSLSIGLFADKESEKRQKSFQLFTPNLDLLHSHLTLHHYPTLHPHTRSHSPQPLTSPRLSRSTSSSSPPPPQVTPTLRTFPNSILNSKSLLSQHSPQTFKPPPPLLPLHLQLHISPTLLTSSPPFLPPSPSQCRCSSPMLPRPGTLPSPEDC